MPKLSPLTPGSPELHQQCPVILGTSWVCHPEQKQDYTSYLLASPSVPGLLSFNTSSSVCSESHESFRKLADRNLLRTIRQASKRCAGHWRWELELEGTGLSVGSPGLDCGTMWHNPCGTLSTGRYRPWASLPALTGMNPEQPQLP